MPGPRRFRKFTAFAFAVSVAAAVLWALPFTPAGRHAAPALQVDDQVAEVTVTLATVILWCFRWLAGFIATCGIAYVIEMMLSQRAWYRRRLGTATGPLRRLPSPRHAR